MAPETENDVQPVDPRIADLVQAGKIQLALFLPQYAKDAATGELKGLGMGFLALEITRALAARLGIAMAVVECPTPPTAVQCLKAGACNLAFLGIEPARAAEIDFTPPVIQFDYTYLVPPGSPIRSVADADRPGVRIAVVRNHASTMTLSRIIKRAELFDAEVPDAAFGLLRAGNVDALAAPREVLLDYSVELPGSQVLSDRYGVNRVAMALPKGQRGRLGYCSEFLQEAKASGLIARAIVRGGLHGMQMVE